MTSASRCPTKSGLLKRPATTGGVWLELFCPDDACFTEEERVRIPVLCEDPQAGKKSWLDLFCPDGSCEVNEATKLP